MVKRYGKPSYDYVRFLDYDLPNYKPSQRKDIVYYEFEKEKQKIKNDYKKKMDAYDKALKVRKSKYENEYEDYYSETVGKYVVLFFCLWIGMFLLFVIAESEAATAQFFISVIIGLLLYIIFPFFIDVSDEPSFWIRKKKKWFNSWIEPGFEENIVGPPPQKPEKPENYPKGRPRIKKTRRYKLTKKDKEEDKFYNEYLGRQKQYQTESICPICNASIQFTELRKPPFEDKCEICEYSFTFIYKKIKEKYDFAFLDIKAFEYDGIKPTRPRAPSKGDYVSDGKRKPIPQDVKDKVWNRDNGKCIQCGSNENLEFDHIIPVSKGGANTYRNLQLLCEHCNRSKSDNIG